jgi:hypothetical protein
MDSILIMVRTYSRVNIVKIISKMYGLLNVTQAKHSFINDVLADTFQKVKGEPNVK